MVKVVLVIADTLRRDHVSVYGNAPWGKIHTPNLARFATDAAVFDHAYIGSFPTGPMRRDTVLGYAPEGEAFNGWTLLLKEEATFLKELTAKKIPSMLVTDVQNNVRQKPLYHRDFTAFQLIRGQEGDPCWQDQNVPLEFSVPHELIRYRAQMWHQILTNRAHRRVESDWLAPQVFSKAMDWLECNYRRKDFFLMIDSFDPHEPWDPPQHYIDMYDPGYKGRVIESPPAGLRKAMGITDRELKHMRARYAAEVTMVDTWFGQLLEKIEQLGISDDTMILFTSDHGNPMAGPGDFGLVRKPIVIGADGLMASAGRPGKSPKQYFPLSLNTTRVPLIVRIPRRNTTRRVASIVQPWDLSATVLDAFNISVPKRIKGASMLPLLKGKAKGVRDCAFSGGHCSIVQATGTRWMYSVWHEKDGRSPVLFDRKTDPNCTKNVVKKEPAAARRIHNKVVAYMRSQGISDDIIAGYS